MQPSLGHDFALTRPASQLPSLSSCFSYSALTPTLTWKSRIASVRACGLGCAPTSVGLASVRWPQDFSHTTKLLDEMDK